MLALNPFWKENKTGKEILIRKSKKKDNKKRVRNRKT